MKYFAGCNESYPRSYKIKEKIEGIEKALEYYRLAYNNFKKINHLYGLYLTKKKEAHLLESYRSYLPNGLEETLDRPKHEKEAAKVKMKKW